MPAIFLLLLMFLFVPLTLHAGDLLPHETYVWQRAWSSAVRAAVAEHGTNFSKIVVLAAEVGWNKSRPEITRVAVDFDTLRQRGRSIGLALRVGATSKITNAAPKLAELAASQVAAARAGGVEPVELQIDFDCATARLDDYTAALAIIQRRLAPLSVTITALPSWLDSPAFSRLAAMATNYVLQVHSLTRSTNINQPVALCDPVAARRAVARAGELGVPFRVALPTYGYQLAFDAAGRFKSIAAETPGAGWPAGTQFRELRADPMELAALVLDWQTNRTPALRSVIWYRLPVVVDNLNWRWPTLAAIVEAREPQEKFLAVARRVEAGLVEISLVNNGELDISSRFAVEARWSAARFLAGDGLRVFQLAEHESSAAKYQTISAVRLPAGSTQTVGWLRLDQDSEVQLEVKKY